MDRGQLVTIVFAACCLSSSGCHCLPMGDWTSATARGFGGVVAWMDQLSFTSKREESEQFSREWRDPLTYAKRSDESSPDYQEPSRESVP